MIKSKTINVVVYSKDRAMQLTSALHSFLECFKDKDEANVTVVFKTSNIAYENAYLNLVVPMFQNVKFVQETDFKKNTLDSIDPYCKYTMFLMDDIFFYNDWSLQDEPFKLLEKHPDGVLAVSLRLSSQTNYCYPISREQKIPNFYKNCAWKWTEADGDFAYPMSLDGNVFHTSKILEILTKIPDEKFTHPNTLEGALNDFAQMRKFSGTVPQVLTCYPEASRLFNFPCNRVQGVIQNKHENTYSPEELNEALLRGTKMSTSELIKMIRENVVVNAAHFIIPKKVFDEYVK